MITKEMIDNAPQGVYCVATLDEEQEDLMDFIQGIFAYIRTMSHNNRQCSYILLIVFIYRLLKLNKGAISMDFIMSHYNGTGEMFTRQMWREEFEDEQPCLYLFLMFVIDTFPMDSIILQYIAVMYVLMRNNDECLYNG